MSYKNYFSDKKFIYSLLGGCFFLFISLICQHYANAYTIRQASMPVTDVILSNTRVYDVGGIFVYGSVLLFLFVLGLCVLNVKYTPFIMKSVAFFTIIRAFFISLTHIRPYVAHASINSIFFSHNVFSGIFTGDGLFFSGHTGIPFLLALIFWKNKYLRIFFICFSVLFGFVVLLGHLHYSIDVLSAFFITYSIFDLCKYFFKKDWALFLSIDKIN